MSWLSVSFELAFSDVEAVTDALFEAGALSVDVEDAEAGTAAEEAQFAEGGAADARAWRRNRVRALVAADTDVPGLARAACARAGIAPPDCRVEAVADQDWVRATQSQFPPMRISGRLWIVPTWHAAPDPAALNIVLDPGLAFGTGTHPTTRMCLNWLERVVTGGATVIDYGCGSGILAIAAMKLGAGERRGHRHRRAGAACGARECNSESGPRRISRGGRIAPAAAADIVVANILSRPLVVLAPLLAALTAPGGRLALAGVLASQAAEVGAAYEEWFEIGMEREEEGWVLLTGVRKDEGALMAMVTRCPACNTTFRVAAPQLQAQQGMVRCGRCLTVFDGFTTLSTVEDPAAPDTAQPPAAAEQALPAATVAAAPQDTASEPAFKLEPVSATELAAAASEPARDGDEEPRARTTRGISGRLPNNSP